MTKAYHGKNSLSYITPRHDQEILIKVKTQQKDMNFVLKVIEAYSHMALAVQLDPQNGILGFHTTKDSQNELLLILESIPRNLEFLHSN